MSERLPSTPWGELPPVMRILFIRGTAGTDRWLADAVAADSATKVQLHEAVGIVEGLARLRDEVFDTVLIGHEPGCLDALELLDAVRTTSTQEQPILVLGDLPENELSDLCFESGADAYLCLRTTTTRALLWQIARASERHRLLCENRLLLQAKQHRQRREQADARRLLQQQRELVGEFGLESAHGSDRPWIPPRELAEHYREMLQTYVVMGVGNLSLEMKRLTSLLVTAGVNATQAMSLHVVVLEGMISELGNRSARHVMNRADLLIMEVLLHLSDAYQRRLLGSSASHELREVAPPRCEFRRVGLGM